MNYSWQRLRIEATALDKHQLEVRCRECRARGESNPGRNGWSADQFMRVLDNAAEVVDPQNYAKAFPGPATDDWGREDLESIERLTSGMVVSSGRTVSPRQIQGDQILQHPLHIPSR